MKILYLISSEVGMLPHLHASKLIYLAYTQNKLQGVFFTKQAVKYADINFKENNPYLSLKLDKPLLVCSRAAHEYQVTNLQTNFCLSGNSELLMLMTQSTILVQI